MRALDHGLDQLRRYIGAHAVVEAPPGKDDFRVIADRHRLVREVIRIDADAMAADKTRAKGEKIPLRAGRLQHRFGVDAHAVEDHRQFVDQRDIEIALGVFDHLGGLGHA